VTLPFIASIQVAGSTTPIFYNANVANYGDVNSSQVQTALNCKVNTDGSQSCTPVTPNANILSIAGVFGDFIDGLHTLEAMAIGIFLPYFLLTSFGVSVLLAGIYNFAMMLTWGALLIYVVSARDIVGFD